MYLFVCSQKYFLFFIMVKCVSVSAWVENTWIYQKCVSIQSSSMAEVLFLLQQHVHQHKNTHIFMFSVHCTSTSKVRHMFYWSVTLVIRKQICYDSMCFQRTIVIRPLRFCKNLKVCIELYVPVNSVLVFWIKYVQNNIVIFLLQTFKLSKIPINTFHSTYNFLITLYLTLGSRPVSPLIGYFGANEAI